MSAMAMEPVQRAAPAESSVFAPLHAKEAPRGIGRGAEAQPELGHDFAQVRVHSDAAVLRREPEFPDATCDGVQDNVRRAWPTAKDWVRHASRRLANAEAIAGDLGRHFKLDPSDTAQAGDLAYIRGVFGRMAEIFDMDIPIFCTPSTGGDSCRFPHGRPFGAFVTQSGAPLTGITYCIPTASAGLLGGQHLIALTVHEVAHLADSNSTDIAYRYQSIVTSYAAMTRAQARVNAESYAELARDLYVGGTPPAAGGLMFPLGFGTLLSAQRPLWVITAGEDFRSRTGLEVFDLVGGLHVWIGLGSEEAGSVPDADPDFGVRSLGGALDLGFISRSPDTGFFVDTRAGVFVNAATTDVDPTSAGITARALVGWASGGFRAGIDARLLYDLVEENHGFLVGLRLEVMP